MKSFITMIVFFILICACATVIPATSGMKKDIVKTVTLQCPSVLPKVTKFAADGKITIYEYVHVRVACMMK